MHPARRVQNKGQRAKSPPLENIMTQKNRQKQNYFIFFLCRRPPAFARQAASVAFWAFFSA